MKILLRYFSFLSWLIFTSNFLLPSPQTLQSINQFCEEILFYVRVKLLKTLTSIWPNNRIFFFQFLKTPDKYLNDISEKWTFFLLLLKLATKQKAAQIHVCSKHILELLTNKAKQSLVYQSSLLSLKFRVKGTNHSFVPHQNKMATPTPSHILCPNFLCVYQSLLNWWWW